MERHIVFDFWLGIVSYRRRPLQELSGQSGMGIGRTRAHFWGHRGRVRDVCRRAPGSICA